MTDTNSQSVSRPADHRAGELTAVTLFDLSGRTQVELTGADRAKFLHGFCTNDIQRLEPGQGCEAILTNIKGKAVGHVFVFATATALWLDTVAGQAETITTHLDRYLIREDVTFHDRSNELGELFLTGPHAAQLLMLDEGLPSYGHVERESFGQPFVIRRADLFHQPGFLISLPLTARDAMLRSLLAVGVVSGSSGLFESLRIAAGFPLYGRDITDENLAQEVARTPQCISFTKGCYLGQEPIARLDALGHTNRELRRVRFATGSPVTPGMKLFAADSEDEAGILTSVAPLRNEAGETLALGYLKTKFGKPDTPVKAFCGTDPAMGIVLATATSS